MRYYLVQSSLVQYIPNIQNQEAWLDKNEESTVGSTESWEPVTNDGWVTTATTTEPTTVPPPMCPVQWHGQNRAKINYRSKTTFVVKINILGKQYSTEKDYFGFLLFPKFNCGLNFINLVESGIVSLDIGIYIII